jgi:hypothetical protein
MLFSNHIDNHRYTPPGGRVYLPVPATLPKSPCQMREAGFRHRGQIGETRTARFAGDHECAQLSFSDELLS